MEHSSPCTMPIARQATCALMSSPAARAASTRFITARQRSGAKSCCSSVNDSGRPLDVATARSNSNSLSSSSKSEISCITPLPVSPTARPMACSSLEAAPRLGTACPLLVRCTMVRDDVNPNAPAATASFASAAICATSASVATSRPAPRSPITNTRSAPCGICAPRSIARGIFASASRYCGKLSQSHCTPSDSTASGMSSTPSISSIIHWRWLVRAGAKPTPQLPMIAVVTPCHEEGVMYGSHVACPS